MNTETSSTLTRYFPCAQWLSKYNKITLLSDLSAAMIVTVLLIPQSLAYALLAGVPAEIGLYASVLPLVAYALFGTSRTLSVGPVAVVSLMTATTLGNIAAQGSASYLEAAVVLALLSGVFLLLMGLLRLGFVANFLSHAVISGFITASGIIIALSQCRHLLGIEAHGDTLTELLPALLHNLAQTNTSTLLLSVGILAFLYWSKTSAADILMHIGLSESIARVVVKIAPIVMVFLSVIIVFLFNLSANVASGGAGVAIVGFVPSGLPALSLAVPSLHLIEELALPALLISVIGYVESISVGRTLGSKRGQKIDANQELIALGAANIVSSVSGAFPVTGGFSRSVVNFEAGAVTQAASMMAAAGIALASLFLTPVFYYLPKATLGATIVIAVLSLIDLSILKKTWQVSKSDFMAVLMTLLVTLFFGVEVGVASGIAASIGLHLYRTSIPHIAEVGLVEGTEHFRNVRRYKVGLEPEILTLRVDESLFFANASFIDERIMEALFQRDRIAHVILMCSAVNDIDYSALETLRELDHKLCDQGVTLHLSEVKGPVLDKLKQAGFIEQLSGELFMTQYQAYKCIKKSL